MLSYRVPESVPNPKQGIFVRRVEKKGASGGAKGIMAISKQAGDTTFIGDRDSAAERAAFEQATVRKAAGRLLPFLFFLYVIAYLDRVNVGFAKLHMNDLPWFSEKIFGFGAGVFFLGYFLFEVPSNLILQRVGARLWIARIMVTWGIVAAAMLFASSMTSFFVLRFLLGIAEAGFFPGILLYMTFWFTAKERARVVALFMTANAVAFILGGPLSGWILNQPPRWGLLPYQQMFLFEAIPAMIMGFVVLWYLPDGPTQATWLTPEERDLILRRVEQERTEAGEKPDRKESLLAAFNQPAVYLLCATFFFLVTGMYGISMWLPQLIKTMGKMSDLQTGFVSAIPYLTAAVVMVINGFHSDRTQERAWHITIPALVGAAGLIGCAYAPSPVLSLVALSIAAAGMWATLGPFWALPPLTLRRAGIPALAGGIALINSVGNLGGFIGPFAVGWVKDTTKTFTLPLLVLAACVITGALLALAAGNAAEKDRA